MNGLFNLLAALLIGGAIVVTGYALTRDGDDEADQSQIEQLADKTLAEAEEKFRQTADAAENLLSDADDDGREDPYTADVNGSADDARDVSSDDAEEAPARFASSEDAAEQGDAATSQTADQPDATSSRTESRTSTQAEGTAEEASTRTALRGSETSRTASNISQAKEDNQDRENNQSATAGINTTDRKIGVDKKDTKSFYTENGKPVDKPDTQRFYTENKPIDKPDSQRYYTENKRIDKPDTDRYFTENRRLDKPDSPNFYTENQPLPENRYTPLDNPCLREDGTVYTGPGTVDNPFADTNPCLVEQIPPVLVTELPPEQPLIPRVDLPETPVTPIVPEQPIVVAERCEYRPGQYTQNPYTDGSGYGWLSDVGCYGTFPWTGFGPQPSIPPGGSDYIM
ncbi:hypothetical protein FF098_005145 [Parvularcula flava]|uniref:Uncharacterized protein n=1 Tax=Aquisalinus luteolus TaxID=1566827 RepID=A0A8J3EQR5_9PROT|nr:hypothetical protein [Aquisalinus luteolus]NHK27283.1 hypothetical protein [Aquisalinus luteolus]GGH94966.1 hypothetical protein GCM10011355_10390 [Aquisalinus luteolus]